VARVAGRRPVAAAVISPRRLLLVAVRMRRRCGPRGWGLLVVHSRLALAKAAASVGPHHVIADGLGQSGPFGRRVGHVHGIDKAEFAGSDPIGEFQTP